MWILWPRKTEHRLNAKSPHGSHKQQSSNVSLLSCNFPCIHSCYPPLPPTAALPSHFHVRVTSDCLLHQACHIYPVSSVICYCHVYHDLAFYVPLICRNSIYFIRPEGSNWVEVKMGPKLGREPWWGPRKIWEKAKHRKNWCIDGAALRFKNHKLNGVIKCAQHCCGTYIVLSGTYIKWEPLRENTLVRDSWCSIKWLG
jgi:hypothetical protein